MAPEQTVIHVIPDPDRDRWLVTQANDGAGEAFETKAEAVEAAKKLAQDHGPAQLQIHGSDGAVEQESTYEEDPLITQLADFGF